VRIRCGPQGWSSGRDSIRAATTQWADAMTRPRRIGRKNRSITTAYTALAGRVT